MAKVTKAKSEGSVFDELFGLLEKEVGGSDRESTVTQFLDTGFAPLNKIISGRYDGGFPVGRIVEISGASSSGKCLTGGTYTLGEKGMLTVDELFKSENFAPNCKQKTAEISVALINENNVLENTSHFVCNGRRKIKRIISSSGRIIEATYNHPIRVMTKEGLIVWKKSGHISVGDTLPVLRGSMQFGRGDLTVNEATFLGYMIADGCLSSHHRVAFSNSDAEIEKEFKRIAWDVFGVEFHTRKHKGSGDHILNNKTFRASLCEKYDLEYVKAAGKKVPLCVRTSNKDVMKEFIRAYMECGCHVYENGIEVTSASETLIRQVQLMLLNFGVYSSIQPKMATSYDQTYWRLHITGANADRYNEAIGFKTKNRLVRVESSKGRTYNDLVPNMGLIIKTLCLSCDTDLEIKRIIGHIDGDKSYETLAAIWEYFDKRRASFNTNLLDYLRLIIDREYIYETVVDVEEDYQPTFDVSIPETHSFWSNGFISHNTAMATKAMIAAQQQGGFAAFVDHERSFQHSLAQSMGMSVGGNYLYKKPNTFEDSVKLFETAVPLIRSKLANDEPICWVIDSLASMIPAAIWESEGERRSMRDKLELAVATSCYFPKLANMAEEHGVCLIFLNQLRENPGVIYGESTKSAGGNAPKYYSSVRISLTANRIMEGTGPDAVMVGNRVTARCIKNKINRPWMKTSWNFMFREDGSGYFDVAGSLLDFAAKAGFVDTSSKGWIGWGDKKYRKSELIEKLNSPEGIAKLNALIVGKDLGVEEEEIPEEPVETSDTMKTLASETTEMLKAVNSEE